MEAFLEKMQNSEKRVGRPEGAYLRGNVYKNRVLIQNTFTVFHFFPSPSPYF